MHDLLIHTRTDTHIHTANCHYSKVWLCCASPVDCWCFPHLWKENKYMHAAPVFSALPGRYAAAARSLLRLIHMHTHIFPNTHTTHRHTYGGGMSTKYCHQSFLACLSPTFFFTNNHYDEFRASLWAKRRKRIRREEKLNCFLWPQDPNWALEHYRATYVLDHM